MNRKLVFLDLDGTIVRDGFYISDKVRRAIREAREAGHYVCIATGRTEAEVEDFIKEAGFDGRVCAAGAHIIWQERAIREETLSRTRIKAIAEVLDASGGLYFFEGPEALYVKRDCWNAWKEIAKSDTEARKMIEIFDRWATVVDDIAEVTLVNKVSYHGSAYAKEQVTAALEKLNLRVVTFSVTILDVKGNDGEITQKGYNKGEAIRFLADYLGIKIEDTIAIGDSENDQEMIEAAGVGIAMGNADDSIKRLADEVTESINDEGVYYAFLRHGLINIDSNL